MASPTGYKIALNNAIIQVLGVPDHDSPLWISLPHPNQETLDDAHSQQTVFQDWFTVALLASQVRIPENFHTTCRRPVKIVDEFRRTVTTITGGNPNVNALQVHSDFVATRIVVDKVQDIFPGVEALRYAAATGSGPPSVFMMDKPEFMDEQTGRLTDIVFHT